MKHYSIRTLIVGLPEQSNAESVMLALPDDAIPIGVEVRPLSMPEGLFLHHLIPCDKDGNIIGETLKKELTYVYEKAWNELYKLYSERSEQDNLDIMDSVLKGVILEMESEGEAEKEAEKGG